MTLRVAHVLSAPGCGGVPRVAEALIRHSSRKEIAPHVFYLKSGRGTDRLTALGVPVGKASGHGGKTGAIAELADWLAENRIDVLHSHSYRPNLYARMAGALLRPNLRIVAHYHNDYSDKWADPVARSLERRLSGVTDARIAVSSDVAAGAAEHLEISSAGITIIENGLDRGRLRGGDRARGRAALEFEEDAVVVALVGRVCAQKGVDTFVRAALSLAVTKPAFRFVVIGDPENADLQRRLADDIAAAGQTGTIRFVGHREDMGDVLAAIDLLAAPSRWEGFGMSLVEAMWMGVPVVASNVGAIPSVTAGAACLVPPEDPAALATSIRAVLSDPGVARDMAEAGRERARAFDWQKASDAVREVYRGLA